MCFYLPLLKTTTVYNDKSNNETVCLFCEKRYVIIMYMCHCLLRLSNDVEMNPGPTVYDIVDPTTTVLCSLQSR